MNFKKTPKIWITISISLIVAISTLFSIGLLGTNTAIFLISLIAALSLGQYLVMKVGWYKREIVVVLFVIFIGILISKYYPYLGLAAHLSMLLIGLMIGFLFKRSQLVDISGWTIIFLGVLGMAGVEIGLILMMVGVNILGFFQHDPLVAMNLIEGTSLGIIMGSILAWATGAWNNSNSIKNEKRWNWKHLMDE